MPPVTGNYARTLDWERHMSVRNHIETTHVVHETPPMPNKIMLLGCGGVLQSGERLLRRHTEGSSFFMATVVS